MNSKKPSPSVSNSVGYTMDCFRTVSDLIKSKTAAVAEVETWYANGDIDDADKIRLLDNIVATYEANKKSALFPSSVPLLPALNSPALVPPTVPNAPTTPSARQNAGADVPSTATTRNNNVPVRPVVVDLTPPHLVSPPLLGKRTERERDTDRRSDSTQLPPVSFKAVCPLLEKIEYGLRNEYKWTIKEGKGVLSGRTVYIPPGNFYTLEGRPVLNKDYFVDAEEAMNYAHSQQGQLKPKGVVWMST